MFQELTCVYLTLGYVLSSPWAVGGAQRTVGCHRDAMGVTVVDQLRLVQIRAALHLRHTGKEIQHLIT